MSTFQIEEFTVEAPANPYTDAVQALIDAGPGKALSITVPRGAKRDGTPGDGGADRLKFQQAANAVGRTARVRKTEDAGDGNVKITFTLTDKHNRGPRTEQAEGETVEATEGETVEETAPVEDAPAEDAPEAEGIFGRRGRRG